MYHAAGVG